VPVSDQLLWYTTRAAGAVSMLMLTGVVMLGILSSLRFKPAGRPGFVTTTLHRNVALLSLVFLALHIVTAVVDPFTSLGWAAAIVPFSSYYRTFWLGLGTVAFELIAAVTVTSLLRGSIGHHAWRAIHWLTYAAWPVAIVHGLGTGTDAWSAWLFALTCGCVAVVGFSVIYRMASGSRDPLAEQRADFRAGVERRPDR
jgi:methionine sulfoxide reductase heme-binding subunit